MPADRSRQDREEKRLELVTAARRLFIEDGYEATPMSALAEAAGVAGNTIYWYFGDKDDALVAVLDAVLDDAMADYQQVATQPLKGQLLWVVDTLQQMRRLVVAVHSRAVQSPAVDEWHTNFHRMAESLSRSTFGAGRFDRPGRRRRGEDRRLHRRRLAQPRRRRRRPAGHLPPPGPAMDQPLATTGRLRARADRAGGCRTGDNFGFADLPRTASSRPPNSSSRPWASFRAGASSGESQGPKLTTCPVGPDPGPENFGRSRGKARR